jgi:hypothetical protein
LYSKRDENTDELIFKNIILPVNKIWRQSLDLIDR